MTKESFKYVKVGASFSQLAVVFQHGSVVCFDCEASQIFVLDFNGFDRVHDSVSL